MLAEETNWVTNVTAGLALAVSGLALYLQRRDSKPRLSISASTKRIAPQTYEPTTDHFSSEPAEWAQIFEIRNVGTRQVRIVSTRARWLWERPKPVDAVWKRTPLLEPDTSCECTLFTSKVVSEPLTRLRRRLPFYRVEFLDQVGRAWSAGYKRVRV